MGLGSNITGAAQNQSALQASQQESASGLAAQTAQVQQFNQMLSEQNATDALVASRTANLVSQLTPQNAPAPYQPTGLNTIMTSELGAPNVTTKRSSLLGN